MNNSLRISSGSVSDRGLSEKRPQNEDSYLEMAQCGIYAVADGVGGAQAGEVASQMAVEILGEAFTNLPDGADAESVMRIAIERANAAIFEMAHELPQLATMATTVVALHLAGNVATIGHVGDSRLYRVDRDGNIYRETDDHSMVGEEVRAGRMTEEQAETHPSRNIISRAVGAELEVEVDLKTIMVEPGSAFLICSDGITRHVGDQEIKGVLTFGGDPAEICEYLKGLCYERGAEDNLTAVVIKVAASTSETTDAAIGTSQPDFEEERTVSAARSPVEQWIPDNDDDGLLELETRDLLVPDSPTNPLQATRPNDAAFPTAAHETTDAGGSNSIPGAAPTDESQTDIGTPAFSRPEPQQPPETARSPAPGDSVTADKVAEKFTPLAWAASAAGLLLLGGVIALGFYHFAFSPVPAETGANPPLELRSENIAFTSFEKNRRNVDADPAAYLKEVPPPEDAEDFYLIGRANLLTGDKLAARRNLVEAQRRVAGAEAANARILAMDIWVAIFATGDSAIENRLKAEVDRSLGRPADANAGAIR